LFALVDSDLIAYRISFACKNESETAAKYSLNSYLNDILVRGADKPYADCFTDDWKLYLTGSNNFRMSIAKTAVYKGNRLAPKPPHLAAMRKHLVDEWGAIVVDGQEADDAVAIDATCLGYNNSVICSVDKDLDQIPGWHYNFVKDTAYHITPEEGMYRFYKQILTGDSADNIIGLKGVGPIKADKMLEDCDTEEKLYEACLAAYDGDAERVLENAQLLWLRRYEGQTWTPPERSI
jgi:hypothetical protein